MNIDNQKIDYKRGFVYNSFFDTRIIYLSVSSDNNNDNFDQIRAFPQIGSIISYPLKKINNDKLQLIELALHDKNESDINFYQPPDESHVSYSLTNWRGDYSSEGSFITVKTATLKNIKEKNKIDHISLLKLDIEGAEISVLKSILNDKIFPKQIAVEFSDLWRDEYKPIIRLSSIFIRLLINGYRLVDISRYPNFLFIRK